MKPKICKGAFLVSFCVRKDNNLTKRDEAGELAETSRRLTVDQCTVGSK